MLAQPTGPGSEFIKARNYYLESYRSAMDGTSSNAALEVARMRRYGLPGICPNPKNY